MEIQATTRFVRMAPSKARDLARALKGLPVGEALRLVEFNARKAALQIGKTLKSAIANAENNAKVAPEKLYVDQVLVDDGPRMKRFWARSRGMVSPIQRRLCHIKITLTEKKSLAK